MKIHCDEWNIESVFISRSYNTFSSHKLILELLFVEGAFVTRFLPC